MKKEQLTDFLVCNKFMQGGAKRLHENASLDDYLKWVAFINFINTKTELDIERRNGNDLGAYYGLRDGITFGTSYPNETKILSLDEAIQMFDIQYEDEENYVVLFNRIVCEIDEAYLIDCPHSEYYEQWAKVEDTVEIASFYGGGIALRSESGYDINDDWFVHSSKSDFSLLYSDFNGGFISTNWDYSYYGVINSSGTEGWFNSEDYIYDDDDNYYATSRIAEYNEVYYDESRDCWTRNNKGKNNADYHSLSRQAVCDLYNTPFRVGFEIEKEDSEYVEIKYQDLYDSTKWIKEKDGSLDGEDGYELISPTMDLFSSYLEDTIAQHPDIKSLINGDFSESCGGHINLSAKDYSPEHLLEGLSGFFPLLYSMYEDRIDEHYCKAKLKHRYYDSEKYSAIYLRGHLIEFRIFPAVINVKNLLWRRDLIRIMCNNINSDELAVLRMMTNSNSILHKHLRKVFTEDKIIHIVDRFLHFANVYCNKKITPPKHVDKFKKKPKNKPDDNDITNNLGA